MYDGMHVNESILLQSNDSETFQLCRMHKYLSQHHAVCRCPECPSAATAAVKTVTISDVLRVQHPEIKCKTNYAEFN